MDHIEFDFFEDFSRPLIRFLQRCGIEVGMQMSEGKIRFPVTLFLPPERIVRANAQSRDPMRKRERVGAKSSDTRIETDAEFLSPKVSKRSVVGY